ncbi:membrane fusion protein of RND family multidrug efflux pump [Hafnia paralvei ATCC 29927]|jgi:membrane fusion protein, multidrug efflux system|uniref:MexE family multidrug efflux RND transporter periplasmic adaptor subunit n=1 Tax=Hafnia paralvei TaxID=546367 RepID=A0A2A2M7F1_9GAMM|nr:efflux RND transporter periplasmic adaptor subunit [Hafnia paralvei]EFV40343.1 acriflavine resistance protein A [Enterobacteriaceae bacterium 9_2_54FAA]MDU1193482.1 efflux RND transporter periplasmic adaptor subunit [Enterobacteriaceae bacterium]AMH18352.1 MexE family multidrug efflux RND transporter periplasmic adaptor subunit [Hafnia paralvei]MBU2672811.1 efflux RND transporter periplasmic adaptor subunit [Hafnia paralvei]MBW2956493.1 efflux RND transporter periplasmic adaptor subunit [Ha
MNKNRGLTPLAAVLMLSGSLLLTGCNDGNEQKGQQSAPEVGVVTLKAEPLNITTELPGRTSAYRIAEVRPQVGGIILKRNFVEGSDIQAGSSLYQIDPATYQAAYDSARGDLAKAEAAANIARLTVNRYKTLVGTKYISQQEYDTAVADARQADAAVTAAKAAVETARINLAYTKVTSPINGRIGKSSVTEGALVTSNQANALATVQQLDPIYVDVTQSSNDFLRLKEELANGTLEQEGGKAKVELILENGQKYPQVGALEFSDVTVDESTGSITIRAVFPNPKGDLLPGMFVRARLDEGIKNNALLVPQQGVTRNPRGEATVMVVGADNKVENRTVTAAQAIGDKWLVTAGLKSGDKVIVTGLQKIRPGVQVKVEEASAGNASTKDAAASEPKKS